MQYVLTHGERHARGGFVVCVLREGGVCDGSGRFTICVPKKAVRGAVLRNRLRRVLCEVVQSFAIGCVDLVVLCRSVHGSEKEMQGRLRTLLGEVCGV